MADIEERYVNIAKRLVLEKFPEMADAEPSLSRKRYQSKGAGGNSDCSNSSGHHGRYVLTFEKEIPLPEGRSLKRLVRVTMDECGDVVKLTSSK